MKGYYSIYECSQNQWLMENSVLRLDRDYYTHTIGTKHALQINQSYNFNPNLPQIEVIDTQNVSVLVDNGTRINSSEILKFETMLEAETHILTKLSSAQGYFYSIRKIYF